MSASAAESSFAALEAHAASRVMPIGPVESRRDGGTARSPGRRTARLWRTFARLPLAAARLILEIAPVIAFAAAGNLLLATSIGAEPVARIAILALVNAYVICGTVMSLARAFASSRAPEASSVRSLRSFEVQETTESSYRELTSYRRELRREYEFIQDRIAEIETLQARFSLLAEHYASDEQRSRA